MENRAKHEDIYVLDCFNNAENIANQSAVSYNKNNTNGLYERGWHRNKASRSAICSDASVNTPLPNDRSNKGRFLTDSGSKRSWSGMTLPDLHHRSNITSQNNRSSKHRKTAFESSLSPPESKLTNSSSSSHSKRFREYGNGSIAFIGAVNSSPSILKNRGNTNSLFSVEAQESANFTGKLKALLKGDTVNMKIGDSTLNELLRGVPPLPSM